jgi:hypothetical protein
MKSKSVTFANLIPLLNDGGVLFGTTILGEGKQPNFLARRLLTIYNKKGVFSNREDNLADLESSLQAHFANYSTHVVGHVAFFVGRIS